MALQGNTAMDINIAKMESWKQDYESEMNQVTQLLAALAKEIAETPAEDDPIMKHFVKVGRGLENAWGKMKETFDILNEGVGGLISDAKKRFNETFEKVKNVFK